MSKADETGRDNGTALPLGSKSEVYAASPLPGLDSVSGTAYLARMKGANTADLMALLCRTARPPRTDLFSQLRAINLPGLVRLIDHGAVNWSDGNRYYGFVYEQPQNPRLWQSVDDIHAPMSEDAVNRNFITPLLSALQALADSGIMHGGIRPTNIFWRTTGAGVPQLGECVTAPPGLGQPALFEPPDRAEIAAHARGPGTPADDMYAFGVTIALLALGQNPLRGLDDDALAQLRLERGSFAALVGSQRIAPSHLELLRGLLHDDARLRWTADDVAQWQSGQRATPKSGESQKRPQRALLFEGREHGHVRTVIRAMADYPAAAMQLVERGELDRWLRRSLGDDETADRLADVVDALKNSGRAAHFNSQLVAVAGMALDPSGPIFYRGMALTPLGLGPALAELLRTGGNAQPIAEAIVNQFVGTWVNLQPEGKTELVPLAQLFEKVRGLIEKPQLGGGIERAAYELNPTLPCMSPLVAGQCVTAPRDLLPALEKASRVQGRPREPLDRHLAAWIAARDRGMDYHLRLLADLPESPRRSLALLNLLTSWQGNHGPEQLPGVAGWLLGLLEPLTRRYYNRQKREDVTAMLQQVATRGRLAELQVLLDDPRAVERDRQNFTAARLLFRSMSQQIVQLERQIKQPEDVAARYGRPVATYVAWVLSALAAAFSILNVMTRT